MPGVLGRDGAASGFDVPSFGAGLLTTAVIAVINALVWPLVIRVLLPLAVFSFGLGSLVLNAVVVSVAVALVDGEAPPSSPRSPPPSSSRSP